MARVGWTSGTYFTIDGGNNVTHRRTHLLRHGLGQGGLRSLDRQADPDQAARAQPRRRHGRRRRLGQRAPLELLAQR